MSRPERSVQDQRAKTDCAIHGACTRLASDPLTFRTFQELLLCARKRSPRLFEAPVVDARHLGVEALVNLARFRDAHIRPIAEWTGSQASWRPAISSLAHHLICSYRVPTFMSSVWHACDSAGDRKRAWVIAHASGASFRSLDLPFTMTRKMERLFLASRDHLALETALRRAELLALGVPADFTREILSSRLGTDLQNGEFWRTVWLFMLSHAREIELTQICPMIDYIQSVRHDHMSIEAQDGFIPVAPPQPTFSVKGRTMASMLRLMQQWHRNLSGITNAATFSWSRSPFRPWMIEEPKLDEAALPKRWHMVELTSSAQLREEGAALHHCVGSYAHLCSRGTSSIWSLRMWRGEKMRPVLTVEVDPKRRAVVQARARANRPPSGRPRRLLLEWASREGLQMAL